MPVALSVVKLAIMGFYSLEAIIAGFEIEFIARLFKDVAEICARIDFHLVSAKCSIYDHHM